MKKITIICAAVLAMAHMAEAAKSVQASQEWVKMYVSNVVSQAISGPSYTVGANGAKIYTIGGSTFTELVAERYGLRIQDVSPIGRLLGLSDGLILPYVQDTEDGCEYRNGNVAMFSTATNIYLMATSSVGLYYPAGTVFAAGAADNFNVLRSPNNEVVCTLQATKNLPVPADK